MKRIFVFISLMCVVALNANAKIWRVNNALGVSADFAKLSDAIDAAAVGDTLYVEGSATSYDGATLEKRLTIIGPGYYLDYDANEKTQWFKRSASIGSLLFNPGSEGALVSGLYLNTDNYLSAEHVTIERCFVYRINLGNGTNMSCDGDTIRNCAIFQGITSSVAGGSFSAKGLMVYNNIIYSAPDFRNGLADVEAYFINNCFVSGGTFYTQNCVYQNNIIYFGFFGEYGASNFFTNNIFNSPSSVNNVPEGNNNQFGVSWGTIFISPSPDFWNSTPGMSPDGQYMLAEHSPAKGAGVVQGTVVDCGAFGGVAPYVLSGMPSIPSIYELKVPSQVNEGTPSINVSISAAAH